jgi:hypothetical protein
MNDEARHSEAQCRKVARASSRAVLQFSNAQAIERRAFGKAKPNSSMLLCCLAQCDAALTVHCTAQCRIVVD